MATAKVVKNISSIPLIVILGSTATGKSKLGIELAKKIKGEIISADSMQVYQGLDIITNKVTDEEKAEVPHHLIDFVKPPKEFTVTEFQSKALEAIKEIAAKDCIPIVVGGTNYYIESLLWEFLITGDKEHTTSDSLESRKEMGDNKRMKLSENEETETLHEKLARVDPERAAELHPNDVRKISRSLQVYEATGRKHSELMKEQKSASGASHLGGPLRFSKSLVFWLTCEQSILDDRISTRVGSMVDKGLVKEVSAFYQSYKESKYGELESHDSEEHKRLTLYEEGLFQAIGFKEFHEFFTNEDGDDEKKKRLLNDGLETLKRNTIKYSKKQRTWIKNRFLSRSPNGAPDVYGLDASDLDLWNTNVYEKAERIVSRFFKKEEIGEKPLERISPDTSVHTKHVCDICDNKIIIGDLNWKKHLTARRHRRISKRKREGYK